MNGPREPDFHFIPLVSSGANRWPCIAVAVRYHNRMLNSVLFWITAAYLSGSVPFGLLLGLSMGIDIRQSGSGNVGATNAGRMLGRKWGLLCFALDVLKGFGPVFACGWAMGYLDGDVSASEAWAWLAVAAAAMLGHIYPVWLKFKGGKGVATGLGILLGLWPTLTLPAAGAVVTWLVVFAAWRYVSLASILAAVTIPTALLVNVLLGRYPIAAASPFLITTTVLATLVVVRHRSNIARLCEGTEPRADTSSRDSQ